VKGERDFPEQTEEKEEETEQKLTPSLPSLFFLYHSSPHSMLP
jgi:hypothetical protein